MNHKTILITGASGLIGTAVANLLLRRGWKILGLTRGNSSNQTGGIQWLSTGEHGEAEDFARENHTQLASVSHVLNLAGSSIGDGRFTEKRKATILESRTETTRYAGKALKVAGAKPSHWIQASAIGYYGNSGNQDATERSPAGNLFLSRVCMEWEKVANKQSRALGVDTFSILRLGVVLAPDAPAWKKMLLPFKIGAGGPLGSGEQWFSWVMLEDVVKMVNHLLENPSSAAGIWNGTAPGAVQQKDLATAIGKAYNRPALLPTPAWVLRLALGDMADELVLASCKAVPGAFQSERFQYFYPDLDAALSRLSSSE